MTADNDKDLKNMNEAMNGHRLGLQKLGEMVNTQ